MGPKYIWLPKILRVPRASKVSRVSRVLRKQRKKRRKTLEWLVSSELENRIAELVIVCNFTYIKTQRVFCYVSTGAKTRAYARIWGLGRIFQQALKIEPAYVIEVISEKFNKLTKDNQDMILIHELLHIPKSFSGALVPHKHKGGVNDRTVREIYSQMRKASKK